MIIDVHAHLGKDRVFDEERDEEEIIGTMDRYGINTTIVQAMFGAVDLEEIKQAHDRIYDFSKQYKKRIFGMVTMTPYLKEADFYDEAKRCVKELGFVGLKLHPTAQGVNPAAKVGQFVWEVCADLNIPVMVHTGAGIPFSLPAMCIGRAKQFPEVPCILAHCGMISFAGEAFLAADECENIYLDTSWTAPHHILHMIRKYGAQRVMFAGDEACNVPVELEKYRSLDLTEEERQQSMGGTANQLFHLEL